MMKLPHRLRHRAKYAFTLIELIMTIVVVGVISIPLALLVSQHIESTFDSTSYTIAYSLARFETEKVNNMAYVNIITAAFSNYDGYAYDVSRTVSYVQGSDASAESLKKITVQVTPAGGGGVLMNLITYIAKNVSYGV